MSALPRRTFWREFAPLSIVARWRREKTHRARDVIGRFADEEAVRRWALACGFSAAEADQAADSLEQARFEQDFDEYEHMEKQNETITVPQAQVISTPAESVRPPTAQVLAKMASRSAKRELGDPSTCCRHVPVWFSLGNNNPV